MQHCSFQCCVFGLSKSRPPMAAVPETWELRSFIHWAQAAVQTWRILLFLIPGQKEESVGTFSDPGVLINERMVRIDPMGNSNLKILGIAFGYFQNFLSYGIRFLQAMHQSSKKISGFPSNVINIMIIQLKKYPWNDIFTPGCYDNPRRA